MLAAILIGSFLGAVAGLLPGVGVFTALIMAMPFLSTMDPVNTLILYVAIASVSQFVGSIPAITLGIPGEYSSMPAVIEGKNLHTPEERSTAIVHSAIGSAVGSLVVLGLTLLLMPWIGGVFGFYLTNVQLGLYIAVAAVIIFTSGNRAWVSTIMFAVGLALGSVGYSTIFNTEIATFGYHQLINGLPSMVVVSALFALPQLWQAIGTLRDMVPAQIGRLPFSWPNFPASMFYSVIGFFGGLVPGMTTILSSQAAYNVSKWLKAGPTARITASEVANNAGAFSQLLPMLLLGIPILSSEALLLSLVESRGLVFTLANFSDHMMAIAPALVLINIIGLILAWPLAKYISAIYKLDFRFTIALILIVILSGIAVAGIQSSSLAFYAIIFVLLLPVAWIYRHHNTTPLIFGFLVYPMLADNLYRFLILYHFISL